MTLFLIAIAILLILLLVGAPIVFARAAPPVPLPPLAR